MADELTPDERARVDTSLPEVDLVSWDPETRTARFAEAEAEAPDFDYQGTAPLPVDIEEGIEEGINVLVPFDPELLSSGKGEGIGEGVTFGDVDRTTPKGGPDPASTLYWPSMRAGAIEALGFLVDLPTVMAHAAISEGLEAVGLGEHVEERPILLSDIIKDIFEAPASLQRAITGKEPTWTAGFNVTPRAAWTPGEQFGADVSYMIGAAASFPTGLAGATGKFSQSVGRLIEDAASRNLHSTVARTQLADAVKVVTPNPLRALAQAADQYAARFALGLGRRPIRTLGGEIILGTAAGVGYGSPEYLANHDGQILMDLPGMGEVDVKPSLKILASVGLPVALAHLPSGMVILGDKTGFMPLLERLTRSSRKMAADLFSGMTSEGRYNLAARVWMSVTADPAFMTETFLPAVRAGLFRDPTANPPMRLSEDGTLVPKFGGINPDTMQALRILGLDDTRLAALEKNLEGSGNVLQARLAEGKRRARLLDETFDLLRMADDAGIVPDEAITYDVVRRVQDNLQTLTDEELRTALERARDAYRLLEPQIGPAEASNIAVSMLDDARQASSRIREKLWSPDKIGADAVNASELGDWAAAQLQAAGRNRFSPGYSWYFKLAGRKRLEDIGIGEKGGPLKPKDLGGLKEGDAPVLPDEIDENGLFDVFGKAGGVTAAEVRILELQGWRSDLGDAARSASRNGREKEAHRLNEIRDYIDNNILIEENLIGSLTPENVRNVKIARTYSFSQKSRWGPETEIGKLLRGKTEVASAEFLTKLLKQGPGSGARVDAFKNALNEPQLNIADDTITWEPDPRATLMREGNPDVIEADLLRRFTESVPFGKVTLERTNWFLSRYGEAVDRVPGLRKRFENLENVQAAVDAMSTKITNPTREQIQEAMAKGGSIQDVTLSAQTASLYNIKNLRRLRQNNIAAEYLNADPEIAAEAFIKKAMADPNFAETRARELSRILDTDPTGQAAAGFRGALWNALRKGSLRTDPLQPGIVVPGVDGAKLAALRDKLAPFLAKFFGTRGMARLDELILGSSLQEPGIRIEMADVPAGIATATKSYGTGEAVALGGRTLGQWLGARIGVSGLVATGQGRRVSVYIYKNVGEKEIIQHVEDGFRDVERGAALVARARELPTYEPPPIVRETAERVLEDPAKVGKEALQGAWGLSKQALSKIRRLVQNYSSQAIRRAVRLGLLPAQAESRKIDLETDYRLGPPFLYEDNKVRFNLEINLEKSGKLELERLPEPTITDEEALPGPPTLASRTPPAPSRPIVAGSTLAQARLGFDELAARPPQPLAAAASQGPPPPDRTKTLQDMAALGLNLFEGPITANKGGLASLQSKPRQMVH